MIYLRRVETNKPYVFVSYSNADRTQVFADVKRLQEAGINLWIDTELSRYIGISWKKVVQHAMKNANCKAVLFFASKFSLISDAVRCELDISDSTEVRGTHYGKNLPIVMIEVTPFDSITQFCYRLAAECTTTKIEEDVPDMEWHAPSDNVVYLQKKFFNNDDIMHYCIFNKDNITPLLESLKRFGLLNGEHNVYHNPNIAKDKLKAGKDYLKKGDEEKALRLFEESASYGLADAYFEIGKTYGNRNKLSIQQCKEAESCFQRAIDLKKESVRLDLALFFYKIKEYRSVERVINEIKELELYSNKNIQNKCDKLLELIKGES